MTNETPSTAPHADFGKPVPMSGTSNDSRATVQSDVSPDVPSRFQNRPESENLLDDQLVNRTKKQIRALVQEISVLAKTDCSREDFFEGFLTRTASALASVGGAIWIRDAEDSPLQLHYQINLKQTTLADDEQAQKQHGQLLNKLVEAGEPMLVAPQSGTASDEDAGNPTEYLLVVGPLIIDQQPIGLVEIFQRSGAGPTTQRGYLRFLNQMCEIASEYLSNQRLRSFAEQQSMWQQLEQFIRTVHQGLDTDQTVYTIANEGRRLIDCDRVSVAIAQGRRMRIRSVSGLDSIERRAEQVKKLGGLATSVCRTGKSLWYNGDDSDLPPQIEKKLHDYVDKSHSKMLAIVPLKEVQPLDSESATNATAVGKPIGAIIVEQLKDSRISPTLEKRVEIVVEHSQTALTNSFEHNGIFLMPVWRALGRLMSLFRGGNLVKTTFAIATLGLVVAFLCWYPYAFALGASGVLKPQIQHEVFAQVDGVLQEILIPNGSDAIVDEGQTLAMMSNNDLRVEIDHLEGELNRTRKQMDTLQFSRVEDMDRIDAIMLSGEFSKAQVEEKSLQRRLEIKRNQEKLLEIRSPARGRVVNWQVRQNLLRRPVNRGQNLITIVDPDTEWEIELEMLERRVAHLMTSIRNAKNPLQVTFALVSHPGEEFTGRVVSVDQKLEVHSDDGNSALVRIAFNNQQVPEDLLRSGTRVTAKVHCGKRSIGYVVFHELIETVQSSVMFWF